MTQPNRAPRGSVTLARRLRELREHTWLDQPVTQRQLAEAFGGLTIGTISGYENERRPTTPPPHRLQSYATFFASRRSMDGGGARLIAESDLNADELVVRDRLLTELRSLAAAKQETPDSRGHGI
jgi:transcriptional regulator with XRE-family HTH domain